MATSPPPLSPNGVTSHLSKIIYTVQGPPPCESVRSPLERVVAGLLSVFISNISGRGVKSSSPQQLQGSFFPTFVPVEQ
ncbi:hypothetical protein Q5P01_018412 [Channa striata]|uniref:Uncharacterized protein n=1 Tax=Channa striata TaxID=64152 RepID=A0AA88S913_CHASR|nr:hypothetical protein Q5P01_018412 [Channa striata]